MGAKLQPLRIPSGWKVEFNLLYEIDPDPISVVGNDANLYFSEDLLLCRHEPLDKLVDIGWYPMGDLANGSFGLVVYEGDFRGQLLHEFRSKSRESTVAEFERVLESIADFKSRKK